MVVIIAVFGLLELVLQAADADFNQSPLLRPGWFDVLLTEAVRVLLPLSLAKQLGFAQSGILGRDFGIGVGLRVRSGSGRGRSVLLAPRLGVGLAGQAGAVLINRRLERLLEGLVGGLRGGLLGVEIGHMPAALRVVGYNLGPCMADPADHQRNELAVLGLGRLELLDLDIIPDPPPGRQLGDLLDRFPRSQLGRILGKLGLGHLRFGRLGFGSLGRGSFFLVLLRSGFGSLRDGHLHRRSQLARTRGTHQQCRLLLQRDGVVRQHLGQFDGLAAQPLHQVLSVGEALLDVLLDQGPLALDHPLNLGLALGVGAQRLDPRADGILGPTHRPAQGPQHPGLQVVAEVVVNVAPVTGRPALGVVDHHSDDVGQRLVQSLFAELGRHVAGDADAPQSRVGGRLVHRSPHVLGEALEQLGRQLADAFLRLQQPGKARGVLFRRPDPLDQRASQLAGLDPQQPFRPGSNPVHHRGGDESPQPVGNPLDRCRPVSLLLVAGRLHHRVVGAAERHPRRLHPSEVGGGIGRGVDQEGGGLLPQLAAGHLGQRGPETRARLGGPFDQRLLGSGQAHRLGRRGAETAERQERTDLAGQAGQVAPVDVD